MSDGVSFSLKNGTDFHPQNRFRLESNLKWQGEKMSDLRTNLIKLAYTNPELRGDILPLLKTAWGGMSRAPARPVKPMSAPKLKVGDAVRYMGKKWLVGRVAPNGIRLDSMPFMYARQTTEFVPRNKFPMLMKTALWTPRLRKKLIRLAHSSPEWKKKLLPLIKTAYFSEKKFKGDRSLAQALKYIKNMIKNDKAGEGFSDFNLSQTHQYDHPGGVWGDHEWTFTYTYDNW
jgi:hypothetical protein